MICRVHIWRHWIEINVKFAMPTQRDYRIHFLAIFPPNIWITKTDKIFPEPFPGEYERHGKTDEVEYKHNLGIDTQ
jgi:hypothetical protein